ncbi:uncharacterized protein LOC108941697 isoform X1 [Scleropages formosus]|uniref:uncharacterized protein LOC108941697 isoform X1 n=2 Tax=Scleropages formosus TaxID=113540 RepID=UPI0010FAB6DF|nr:uncharacterized protein LOC108941697 isoform X1 [Scleropages formosus]
MVGKKTRRKIVRTTIAIKKQIIEKYEGGRRIADLVLEYKMPKSTIYTILVNKERIKAADVATGIKSIRSSRRSEVIEKVEKLLVTWIKQKRSEGVSATQATICEQARAFYDELVKEAPGTSHDSIREPFKASRGWFEKFKWRSGEASSTSGLSSGPFSNRMNEEMARASNTESRAEQPAQKLRKVHVDPGKRKQTVSMVGTPQHPAAASQQDATLMSVLGEQGCSSSSLSSAPAGSVVQVSFPSVRTAVLESLNRQREEGQLCDLSIQVQGQVFRAHKCVLAASSPYFHDQVLLKNMSTVSIPAVMDPLAFESVLSCAYTGQLRMLREDIVNYLTVGSVLQMWHIVDKCTELLKEGRGGTTGTHGGGAQGHPGCSSSSGREPGAGAQSGEAHAEVLPPSCPALKESPSPSSTNYFSLREDYDQGEFLGKVEGMTFDDQKFQVVCAGASECSNACTVTPAAVHH